MMRNMCGTFDSTHCHWRPDCMPMARMHPDGRPARGGNQLLNVWLQGSLFSFSDC